MRISIGKSLCALSALALGACGQSASDDQSGGGKAKAALENAAEVAFQMQPGKYRTTMAIQKIGPRRSFFTSTTSRYYGAQKATTGKPARGLRPSRRALGTPATP